MKLFVVVILEVLILCSTGDDQHGSLDAYDEVKEELGITTDTISKQNVSSLISVILRRSRHIERKIECKCLYDVLVYFGENRANETTFEKISVILVTFMRDLKNRCGSACRDISQKNVTYAEYLHEFVEVSHAHHTDEHSKDEHSEENHSEHEHSKDEHSEEKHSEHEHSKDEHSEEKHSEHEHGKSEHSKSEHNESDSGDGAGGSLKMSLHDLETMLYEVKKNYAIGKILTENPLVTAIPPKPTETLQCFSAETLFHELGTDESKSLDGASTIQRLAALIIYHAVKGDCVSPETIAPPHNFLVWLFSKYGENGTLHSDDVQKLMSDMNIGESTESDSGHSGHDHRRRKREMDVLSLSRTRREVADNTKGFSVNRCYKSSELLSTYFGDANHTVTATDLQHLCPALIQQLTSEACNKSEKKPSPSAATIAESYGYGTIAVTLITLCTLIGAPFMKIKNAKVKMYILSCLMALGVGTLCADAALHLIPLGLGLHAHAAHGTLNLSNGLEIELYNWYMFVLVMSIYIFFTMDTLFVMRMAGHSHVDKNETANSLNNDTVHSITREKTQLPVKPRITAMAALIVVGDGIHNLADGLAIGAAFSASVSSGISTSIAVLFHELPHELGDFAALVASGLSIKKALLMNFLSGCTAFIGLYVGVAISRADDTNLARSWIFIITAGMFFYVSLASIIPELKNILARDRRLLQLVLQHVGILLGIAIMFLIAVFEPYISI